MHVCLSLLPFFFWKEKSIYIFMKRNFALFFLFFVFVCAALIVVFLLFFVCVCMHMFFFWGGKGWGV